MILTIDSNATKISGTLSAPMYQLTSEYLTLTVMYISYLMCTFMLPHIILETHLYDEFLTI
jgi:hypothetical protein